MNAAGILEVRPDTKGPKNLAILLFMSAFLVLFMAWQDWQLHGEGLSVNQIEVFLETPNSQPGDPTTVEQYQEFEDSIRDANGYLIRSISLFIAAGCLLIGAPRTKFGFTFAGPSWGCVSQFLHCRCSMQGLVSPFSLRLFLPKRTNDLNP